LYYTASGIVTHCRWPSGAQFGRGLVSIILVVDQLNAQILVL